MKTLMVIPVPQIIRIQSISNYSKLFFKDACPASGGGKTLVVARVLHWFEELPLLSSFVRIHRTHLINTNYIITFSGGNFGILLLSNGEKFSVARRKKAGLRHLAKTNFFPSPLSTLVERSWGEYLTFVLLHGFLYYNKFEKKLIT